MRTETRPLIRSGHRNTLDRTSHTVEGIGKGLTYNRDAIVPYIAIRVLEVQSPSRGGQSIVDSFFVVPVSGPLPLPSPEPFHLGTIFPRDL